MSYKNRRIKRSKLNQLKFFLGLAWNKFFNNLIKKSKEKKMVQVEKMMEGLRKINRTIRINNLRISEWVQQYFTKCVFNGKTVNILTQWCLSKALEQRFEEQGNKFILTKKERRVLQVEIPAIISLFTQNGFTINWWVTFNRSPIDTGLLPREIENKYKEMITDAAEVISGNVVFFDWEDDILGGRVKPDLLVLENFFQYVSQDAFSMRLKQLQVWIREEATNLEKTDEELVQDIKYEAACEANEARLLSGKNPLFGEDDFILVPLEVAERYDNFTVFVGDFKKRVVAVLSSYPWRMKK